jgi:hypothetical protein
MPPKPLPAPTSKTCAHCHRTFTRGTQPNGRPIERRKWLAQTYCSRTCANDSRAHNDTAHLPKTKTCHQCGTTYERPRYRNGKLQSSGEWLKRQFCSHTCQAKHQTNDEHTKTCECCGKAFHRGRHPSGKIRSLTAWQRQTACSRECASRLRANTVPPKPKRTPKAHAPCQRCGNPVERREGERNGHWHTRKYCTVACGQAASADHRRKLARERRAMRFAPKRYVFDGRFPTPAGVRTWRSVSGPDTGVVVTAPNNAVTRSARTLRMLRAAVSDHPDLALAFMGALSDSWVQQDNAA